jgi:hypothetical protein
MPSETARPPLSSIAAAKEQAKRLRTDLAAHGQAIGHGQALDLVARQHGWRDWNTLRARLVTAEPPSWAVGQRVGGHYLGQAFTATVVAAGALRPGWTRLSLDLDRAVDVVTFDSFSAFRKRVTGIVGPEGRSLARTSNGRPHLEVARLPRTGLR